MDTDRNSIMNALTGCGLKITPQRMAVLEVLYSSHNHPTAEAIYRKVLGSMPGISATTIYNTLDTFVEKGLVKRVKTEADIMRYEPVTEHHHHLYSSASDRMEDYFDTELDAMLTEYFQKKQIRNFKVSEIRLQVMGDFEDQENGN